MELQVWELLHLAKLLTELSSKDPAVAGALAILIVIALIAKRRGFV